MLIVPRIDGEDCANKSIESFPLVTIAPEAADAAGRRKFTTEFVLSVKPAILKTPGVVGVPVLKRVPVPFNAMAHVGGKELVAPNCSEVVYVVPEVGTATLKLPLNPLALLNTKGSMIAVVTALFFTVILPAPVSAPAQTNPSV